MVVKPIIVDFASLFNFTTVSRSSDIMTSPSSICFRSMSTSVVGLTVVLLMFFLCSGFRSPLSPLFHHGVIDYMCFTVMFHRLGRGPYADRTEYCNVDQRLKVRFCASKTVLSSPTSICFPTDCYKAFLCNNSLFVRLWFYMWHLFSPYFFGITVIRDYGISWVISYIYWILIIFFAKRFTVFVHRITPRNDKNNNIN